MNIIAFPASEILQKWNKPIYIKFLQQYVIHKYSLKVVYYFYFYTYRENLQVLVEWMDELVNKH